MVEYLLGKEEAIGSSPIVGSSISVGAQVAGFVKFNTLSKET